MRLSFRTRSFAIAAAALVYVSLLSPCAYADSSASSAPRNQESQLVEHGHYVNKAGHTVHSPAHTKSGQAPVGATAKCDDGTYSFSEHRRGTCSHHGGVSDWLTGP